jgi:hypothetical protein
MAGVERGWVAAFRAHLQRSQSGGVLKQQEIEGGLDAGSGGHVVACANETHADEHVQR